MVQFAQKKYNNFMTTTDDFNYLLRESILVSIAVLHSKFLLMVHGVPLLHEVQGFFPKQHRTTIFPRSIGPPAV